MRFSELAIFTDHVDATAAFYEQLLGVAPTYRGEGIAIFHKDGTQVLIHRTYEPGPDDLPCENHVALTVANVDETVKQLQAKGVQVEYPPRDYDWGRSAYLRDPAGHLLELHQESDSQH